MEKLRIKPQFSTVVHNANMVELRHGVWNNVSHMLNDENEEGILSKIVLSLNELADTSAIAKKINISRSKVESVLDYLQCLGVLESNAESFIDYYIDNIVPTLKRPGQFKYQISRSVVLLGDTFINNKLREQISNIVNCEIDDSQSLWSEIKNSGDDWLFDAIEQERFIEQFKIWQGKLIILTSKHINPVLSTRLNRIAYELNIPWIHLAIDGPFILIGPTFQGDRGPCYDCFETRISMNLRESDNYKKYKNAIYENQVHASDYDPLQQITSGLLLTHGLLEIINYLTTQCTFTTNKILTIFLPTMEFVYHDVLRLPACRTCGSVTHRDDTQMYFDFQKLIGEAADESR